MFVCVLELFFFEMKTAYELRISDWGSDVCSSDLCWAYWAYPKNLPRSSSRRIFDVVALIVTAFVTVQAAAIGFDNVSLPKVDALGRASGAIWDRQSVVSGKRVSVRVDLGGRRNIK